jgi:hypothetical protein
MITRLLLGFVLATSAYAQLQVVFYDGTAERTIGSSVNLGATAMSDSTESRFRARNNGVTSVALQSVAVAGQSFSISSKPALPYVVAPGNFVEFRVQFAPLAPGSYSATLTVNGVSTLLLATGVAAPVLTVDNSTIGTLLTAGAPIDFGRILKTDSAARIIRVSNTTTVALQVNVVSVSGATFHGPTGISLPAKLAPGAAATFQLSFDPKTSGAQTGALTVDGRTFQLAGVAYDPPFPQPSISINGGASSGLQPRLAVKLAAASGVAGTGTLTLDFAPNTPATPDDPAIMFVSTGSRHLTFQVAEGDTTASFGTSSQKDVVFQTGTTAGTITMTVQLADYTEKSTIVIAPAAVTLDSAGANRRVSDLDVQMIAFDNTRTAGKFNFTFYDLAGKVIQPGVMAVDTTADFGRYFAISKVGGSFLMRATFPITGDATQIGGVEVELVNAAGSTKTRRLSLQ